VEKRKLYMSERKKKKKNFREKGRKKQSLSPGDES
jgi:hypothetical protein